MQEVIHRKYKIAGLATPTQINLMFHRVMQILYAILSQTTLAPGEIAKEVEEHIKAYLDAAPVPRRDSRHTKPSPKTIKERKCNSESHSLSE